MRCPDTKISRRKLTSAFPRSYPTAVIEEPEGETSLRLQAVPFIRENSTASPDASAFFLRVMSFSYHSRISKEASENRMASAVAFYRSGMNVYESKTDLREYESRRLANISREFKADQPGSTRPEKKISSGHTVYPPYNSMIFVLQTGVW